jgi:2,3-bisphosphoglycerate-independent phosphoglycerate mutase
MTRYEEKYEGLSVMFEKDNLENTLGETISKAGKKQLRIAETEKYPHVTFFFNGGREEPFPGEDRILCPSPPVATYDQQPEMSAEEICVKATEAILKAQYDFVCINFANPDMVGHTGVFEAAVKACTKVDACVKRVVEAGIQKDYAIMILADHGNVDKMRNEDGSPNTAHTTAPVPCILIGAEDQGPLHNGKLGDVAPTLLSLMGIEIPAAMTGKLLC